MEQHQQSSRKLREIIDRYKLHSQELDFIPSITDTLKQMWKNKFSCAPRNNDPFIAASGDYLYCYNDISHKHLLSHIDEMNIHEALKKRQRLGPNSEICKQCNMLNRYKLTENLAVAKRKLLYQ